MDRIDPTLAEVYRRWSSAERIQAGLAATELVRDRLRAEFRHRHPEWSEAEVEKAVARRILEARDGD